MREARLREVSNTPKATELLRSRAGILETCGWNPSGCAAIQRHPAVLSSPAGLPRVLPTPVRSLPPPSSECSRPSGCSVSTLPSLRALLGLPAQGQTTSVALSPKPCPQAPPGCFPPWAPSPQTQRLPPTNLTLLPAILPGVGSCVSLPPTPTAPTRLPQSLSSCSGGSCEPLLPAQAKPQFHLPNHSPLLAISPRVPPLPSQPA